MTHFEGDHSEKVDLFAIDCCKWVSAAKQPQNLLLLLLPRDLGKVKVVDESFLIVSRRGQFSLRVDDDIHKLCWEHHGEELAIFVQFGLPDAQSYSIEWEELGLQPQLFWSAKASFLCIFGVILHNNARFY